MAEQGSLEVRPLPSVSPHFSLSAYLPLPYIHTQSPLEKCHRIQNKDCHNKIIQANKQKTNQTTSIIPAQDFIGPCDFLDIWSTIGHLSAIMRKSQVFPNLSILLGSPR